MTWILAAILGYLAGSIPFAVIVSRLMGLPDPRSFGSGNPGATNVLRTGSKAAAALTLAGDALKGWVAVWVALRLEIPESAVAVVALTAFAGHLFPIWLSFKGGKGVATAAGVLFALDWRVGVAVLVVWLTVVVVSRYSSLGALTAALFAPVALYYLLGAGPVLLATVAMCALLIWRHQPNIVKLMRGTESRIGEKKAASTP